MEAQGNDTITVGNDCQHISGENGNDSITAGDNVGNILGNAGDDTITVGKNGRTIYAGEGDDTIIAGDGSSSISAGAGDNNITLGDNCSGISAATGDDVIIAGDHVYGVRSGGGNDIITARDYAEWVVADDGDDIISLGDNCRNIQGEGGNDAIEVGNNASTVNGGGGDDRITAGDNAAGLNGSTGNDVITAGDGAHTINGGDGDDTITVGDGVDTIEAGAGDDIINAANAATNINSRAGNDVITVGDNASSIYGDEGNDLITAGAAVKGLNGGWGDDIITVGDGADVVRGGDGNDTIVAGANSQNIYGDTGNDIVISNHVDQLHGVYGGAGNNIIIGNVNTPSLEFLPLQDFQDFEVLLRAITDDVAPLDFSTHERLGEYGISMNADDADTPVTLSSIWEFSPEKTTPAVDVFTSYQNGTTLELEILHKKSWDFQAPISISEKEIGKPFELGALKEEGYVISRVLEQGKYGRLEEANGSWYYVLNRPMDSGPIAGPNAVENADSITVRVQNSSGQTWDYAIPVTIIDDAPEITVSGDQEAIEFYLGADGAPIGIVANDAPLELAGDFFGQRQVSLDGKYGELLLTFDQAADTSMLHTASLAYEPYADSNLNGADVFIFKLTDGDGDVTENMVAFASEAEQPDSAITGIDQLTFMEANLYNGSAPAYMELVKNGSLTYSLPAGLAELQIAHDGQTHVIPEAGYENLITDKGIFSVWHGQDAINYSFILSDPLTLAGEAGSLEFEAILTDGAGRNYSGNPIFINIVNDSPRILEDKTWVVDQANPEISGNASDYYLAGADGGVFERRVSSQLKAEVEQYGALTLENDGAYSFSWNGIAPAQSGPFALAYGFADADGDAIDGNIFISIAA